MVSRSATLPKSELRSGSNDPTWRGTGSNPRATPASRDRENTTLKERDALAK
jgi:hypothetical protein